MQIWSFAPSVTLPLFTGGSNLAQLRYAEAQKRGLIATYEKTVQSAFKDVANALARRTTLEEQLDAQRQYVKAEQQTVDVGLRRYQAGGQSVTTGMRISVNECAGKAYVNRSPRACASLVTVFTA